MTADLDRIVVVTGATGHQGGSVTRHLLKDGWHVRALTRDAASMKARAVADLGAEIVQGDMSDPVSLRPVFAGARCVYSVQNPMISGLENEVQQGKNVADAAREAGVQHLVYGSAGTGASGTGIRSWESKLQVEAHMRSLGLPVTVLRPMALMELMIDRVYYPAVSTWHLMPKLMGATRPVGWVCSDDIGAIAAKAFADPNSFIGQDLRLASDVQSIADCRRSYERVMGKRPPHFPMPIWLFKRFVGPDLLTMWRWLGANEIDFDTDVVRRLIPEAHTVDSWLQSRKASSTA